MAIAILDDSDEDVEPILELLLKHGANVNAATKIGEIALQEFVKSKSITLVEMLLDSGSEVNAATEDGETALHWAAGYGNIDMVELLLQHHADITCRTTSTKTPLDWASSNRNSQVERLLSLHRSDVIAQNPDFESTLATAEEEQPSNPRIWGVLIGIDDYTSFGNGESDLGANKPKFSSLKGCVNDILLSEKYLKECLEVSPSCIRKLTAKAQVEEEKSPTYINIIGALQETTDAAAPGDSIYIHFSGHSYRRQTAYPLLKGKCGLDMCLVPTDFKLRGECIRDIELDYMLRKMVEKGLRVTVVIDANFAQRNNATSHGHGKSESTPLLFDAVHEFFGQKGSEDHGKPFLLDPKGYSLFTTDHAEEVKIKGVSHGRLSHCLLKLLRFGLWNDSCSMIQRRLREELRMGDSQEDVILVGKRDRPFHGFKILKTRYLIEPELPSR